MDVEQIAQIGKMPDRINVDIESLRERIEQAHADNPLWAELSWAMKCRRLIVERLEQLEQERGEKSSDERSQS